MSRHTPRLTLLAAAAAAAIAAAACERDRNPAPAPSEADAPWKALVAELDGDRLSVHQKLQALDEFAARFPDDHPYEDEVVRRRRELERAVEADLAAQASRARAYREEQDAALESRRRAVESGSLTSLAGEVVFRFWPWEDETTRDGFEPVTMQVDGRPARTRRAPFEGIGLGTLRSAATDLLAEVVPDLAPAEGDYLKRHDRLNASLNRLLRARLGGDLFDQANPGELDPAALETLLDEIYVAPDAPFVGAKARDVYRLFRPIAWDYIKVYRHLHQRFGRRKLITLYRRALRTHDGSSYETGMLKFYGEFATEHDIATKADLDEPYGAPVIVGFWMRRTADGTDRILIDFARKAAADYDPELAKLLR